MTRAMLALVWVLIPLVSLAADPAGAPVPEAKKNAEKAADTAPANKGAAPEADKQPPRKSYNQGRTAFQSGELGSAEARFLAARDRAEGDDEVRYRAAFNLALTYAQKAAGQQKDKPQDALAALRQSAAWFRDAVRSRPDDPDARHNLELILRRIQQLSDQLNKGQNSLEAALGRVIQDQRTLRDRARGLLARVNQAGAAAEPFSFQSEFEDTSTFQRTLLADAGVVLDRAGEERDHLAQRAEKDRSPQDKGRLVQLQNLEHYLNLGRGTMAQVARLLRRLQGERAHREADVAVTQLKRALEQLQDPVTVLKGLAADQTGVLSQTRALEEIKGRGLFLPVEAGQGPRKAEAPAWLTTSLLAAQQGELQPRTQELLARLQAGVEHESAAPTPAPGGAPADPREAAQRQRIVEAAKQAIPLLQEGTQQMEQAGLALSSEQLPQAARAQEAALQALVRALERFSGLRDLIELAYAEQVQLAALVSPNPPQAELAKLTAAERGTLLSGGVARNLDRLARLKGLFADELAALQQPPPNPQNAPNAPSPKDDAERRAAEKQRYELAEQKRQLAESAVGRLHTLLGQMRGQKGGALQPTAEDGRKHLEELRRLFFSIVEHLKELLRDQTETHDQTSSAQAQKEEAERRRKAGPLATAEEKHAEKGKALAEALLTQAEQAGSAQGQGRQDAQKAQEAQKALAGAADEVKQAHGAMTAATRRLRDDDPQKAQSAPLDLEPAIEQQKKAMAHLEAAIRLLEPPQENQQQQQQDPPQNQEQQLSQEQAARRLQAIREREAERQRKKQPPSQPEPVEKDW